MRHYFVLLFLAVTLSCSAKQGVSQQTDDKHTFVVDENLPAPKIELGIESGNFIANLWAEENKLNNPIAYSFVNNNLCILGQDNFFKCIVEAYVDHHTIVLSPDVIWTLIAQGFSLHINNNPNTPRDMNELVMTAAASLHSPNTKWNELLETFDKQIAWSTKDDLADIMLTDFSSKDEITRIVSQMTFMSSERAYCDFVIDHAIEYMSCGIPCITIEGTPDDWRKVMKNTEQLKKYNLDWWVNDLIPILNEFVMASEGKANMDFWKNIVKQKREEKFRDESYDATELDGWFLKLMPYTEKGKRTPEKVPYDYFDMPAQVICVDFKYKDLENNTITPMKLLGGFVGVEVDSKTNAMRPKLGWIVCEKQKQNKNNQDF